MTGKLSKGCWCRIRSGRANKVWFREKRGVARRSRAPTLRSRSDVRFDSLRPPLYKGWQDFIARWDG